MDRTDVLLIYPQLGSFDDLVCDIPLSLIYAAADSVKRGFSVRIVDLRIEGRHWRQAIDSILHAGCSLVGVSVMTGNPIRTALEVSRYVKERWGTPVVWGGPHPTVLPEQTLESQFVDFVVRGWGSNALCQLVGHLKGEAIDKEAILGLGYKEGDQIRLSPAQTSFEIVDYDDLPYHLVDISGAKYNRLRNGDLIFPIFTSLGCPYRCGFCIAPALYEKMRGKKWIAFEPQKVLDHIAVLSRRYTFGRLQVYDDESFVNMQRMRDFLSGYIDRGFNRRYTLDFRGLRIDHLDRMDDEFLRLMVEANVEMLFIGMESGSQRVLELMNKGITVEQILRANRQIARYPSLKPHYNFFSGIPGETLEDLILTKDVLLQVVKDNPACYLGFGAHWKPIPGSALTELGVREYGLQLPTRLEDWAEIDSFDSKPLVHPWYTKKFSRMIGLLGLAGSFLDAKTDDLSFNLGPVLGRLARLMVRLYRPVLGMRLRHNFTGFLIENRIRLFFIRKMGSILKITRSFRRRANAGDGSAVLGD